MKANHDEVRQWARRELGVDISAESIDDLSLKQRASGLIPHVARRAGVPTKKLKPCLDRISLDKSLGINGCVDRCEDLQRFSISVSPALLMLHYQMVKLFVSRMSVGDDDMKVVEETRISDREMFDAAFGLMSGFYAKDRVKGLLTAKGINLVTLNSSQAWLAAYLLHYMDSFVIAHEFGHVLFNACSEKVEKERITVGAGVDNILRPAIDKVYSETHQRGDAGQWAEEMTADLIGLHLCLEQDDNRLIRTVINGSVELAFILWDMLEAFGRKKKHPLQMSYESHPPFRVRWEFLHLLVDHSGIHELGVAFRKYADYILEEV